MCWNRKKIIVDAERDKQLDEVIHQCSEDLGKEVAEDIKKNLDSEETEFEEEDFWRNWYELKKRFKHSYKSIKLQK